MGTCATPSSFPVATYAFAILVPTAFGIKPIIAQSAALPSEPSYRSEHLLVVGNLLRTLHLPPRLTQREFHLAMNWSAWWRLSTDLWPPSILAPRSLSLANLTAGNSARKTEQRREESLQSSLSRLQLSKWKRQAWGGKRALARCGQSATHPALAAE